MRLTRCFFALLGFSLGAVSAENIDRTSQFRAHMDGAVAKLAQEQLATLARIEDPERRDLAAVYYLRAGASVVSRWSWTQARIDDYQRSAEYADVRAEIDKIAKRFAADNPGFELRTNTVVRSLDKQVTRWGEVNSIGVAARELSKFAQKELSADEYSLAPSKESVARFTRFLTAWRPSKPPTLAAPGLSLHGQGRAFDFEIYDAKGRLIAGTDSSTVAIVWDAQGWTKKLAGAVKTTSGKFMGPLAAPREPWHYEYRPDTSSAKQ